MFREVSKNKKQKKGIFGLIREERGSEECSKTRKGLRAKKRESAFNIGRWKMEEHLRFIEALLQYGNDWKNVQKFIGSRSSTQARSHAQKFFAIIGKIQVEGLNLDFENNSLKSLNTMASKFTSEQFNRGIRNLNNLVFEKKKAGKREKDAVKLVEEDSFYLDTDFKFDFKPTIKSRIKFRKNKRKVKCESMPSSTSTSSGNTQTFTFSVPCFTETRESLFKWNNPNFAHENSLFTINNDLDRDERNFQNIFEHSFVKIFSTNRKNSLIHDEKEKFDMLMMDVDTNAQTPTNSNPTFNYEGNMTDIINLFMSY